MKEKISKPKLKKDKITFLGLHLGLGGIERATVNSANALCNEKDVEIITFYKLSEEIPYDINPNIKIRYLYDGGPPKDEWKEAIKKFQISNIFKYSQQLLDILTKKNYLIKKEIENIKEGIIVSTRIEFSTILSKYGNKNVLKIAQEHNYHDNNKKYLKKMKHHYDNIDYVMVLTERMNKDFTELFKGSKTKVITMPNMLATKTTKVSKLEEKTIISVGRLHEIKRVSEIVEIANLVKDTDWKFKIIGNGPEEENLKEQINRLGLNDKVHLLGGMSNSDIMDELARASIFVMTSRSEGFAIVLIEAFSAGLPAIAYETDNGVIDLIDEGKNGYIIENKNREAFSEKLRELMKSKTKRQKLSKEALKKAAEFAPEKIGKKWLDFLDKAVL